MITIHWITNYAASTAATKRRRVVVTAKMEWSLECGTSVRSSTAPWRDRLDIRRRNSARMPCDNRAFREIAICRCRLLWSIRSTCRRFDKEINMQSTDKTPSATIKAYLAAFALCLFASALPAAEPSAEGLWKTINEKTNKPDSIVRIVETNGEFSGRIEKIFVEPGGVPAPKCDQCEGKFKNQPILGMTFLWGFKREGNKYTGGQILDPDEGQVYHCRMELSADGTRLEVRGYVGIPLFGRTQTWFREP